jgi:phosphatidylinositol 4-kinase
LQTADAVRGELASLLPQQGTNARSLSTPQVIFLATVLGVESLRAESGQPSTILSYFHVEGINNNLQMFTTLTSIADKVRFRTILAKDPRITSAPLTSTLLQVNSTFISHLSGLVTGHTMDASIYREVREILLQCCHQYTKVRGVSIRYLNDLFASFPSLLCSLDVVTVLLELLTALRRACLAEFVDEVRFCFPCWRILRLSRVLLQYTPTYVFHSARGGFSVILPDDYVVRNNVLVELHKYARSWLKAGVTRAPWEMRGLLQVC